MIIVMGILVAEVGKRIKFYRQKLEVSQEEFAEIVGMNKNYLGNIELGKQSPTIFLLEKIINALNISAEEFFTGL